MAIRTDAVDTVSPGEHRYWAKGLMLTLGFIRLNEGLYRQGRGTALVPPPPHLSGLYGLLDFVGDWR